MNRKWRLLIGLGVVALVAAACGGGAAAPDENGEIVITMSEFSFSPNNIEVTAGQTVTFVLVNEGDKEHEFMVGRNVNLADGAAAGFEHDFFEGVSPMVEPMDAAMNMGEMSGDAMGDEMTDDSMSMGDGGDADHAGFMVLRSPAEEARITLTVPADATGEWEIGCFQEDGAHWDDGMKGTLTVVAGA